MAAGRSREPHGAPLSWSGLGDGTEDSSAVPRSARCEAGAARLVACGEPSRSLGIPRPDRPMKLPPEIIATTGSA
jgi:hypothetical protein